MNGTWNLSLDRSNVSVRETELSLTQEERYGPFSGTSSDNATLTGTLNSESIVITLNNADGSVTTLTGVASKDWKSFSGTYTSTGSDGSGTWSLPKSVPAPAALSVTPSSATLSCSAGESQTFTATGGTRASYVVGVTNLSLVTLDTSTLTTNGKFTVTASNACTGANGSIVTLTVTDTSTSDKVAATVTISNP
ncbi:MAG TPA: hypothetical protein VFG09_09475 [Thermodesulfovibrionales bacterium]|nr:hypothetical protein [Thermodesulfovibrionales bacterium]